MLATVDGIPVHYVQHGGGTPALAAEFRPRATFAVLDGAGHGCCTSRSSWTAPRWRSGWTGSAGSTAEARRRVP
jgi:hypothetical protein